MGDNCKKIPAMFAKQTNGPSTKCPICESPASLRQIEDHLNNGCPIRDVPPESNHQNNQTEDLFGDSDDIEYAMAELKDEPDKPVMKASQSISNAPKRFGGTDRINLNGEVLFKTPSPKKPKFSSPFRHRSPHKTSPSHNNGFKKNLFSPQKLEETEEGEKPQSHHVPLTQSKRNDPTHIPYYLVNFETVVRGVIDETDDVRLFDEHDLDIIDTFRKLSLEAKKVYVRLFQRKFGWIQISQIKNDEFHDKEGSLKELVEKGLILDSSKLEDLETILNLVSAPNLKKLSKDFNLSAKGNHKHDNIDILIKHSKAKLFFASKSNSMEARILKKALAMIDPCFCLLEEPRKMFHRIFSLYSLSNWWDERENDRGQPAPQMTTILLQNTGRIVFPNYDIIRHSHIFRHKEDLILFEQAISYEAKISEVLESKNFESGIPIASEAEIIFRQISANKDIEAHVKSLPTFLRKFSTGSVMAYVLSKCVDLFEKLKQHKEAVKILRILLSQKLYLPDYHGFWFERLALDTDQHLRQPKKALEIIFEGLGDEHVRVARKLTLCQRVLKICKMKSNTNLSEEYLERFMSSPHWISPPDPPQKIIEGRLLPKEKSIGSKTVFVYESCVELNGKLQTENLLCSVEELVREHYKRELNFSNGLHGEGAVVNTVCGILFWDVIYDLEVPDAFRGPHQATPLDLNYDDFYANRKESIDARILEIETWSEEQLCDFATKRWEKSCGITACLCNWSLFRSPSDLCSLLVCLSGIQWSAICQRLMKNHRHTRSGFPDLTVWNPDLKICNFVEVKGPNDRLSPKQILWLEFLNSHGIEAIVCHVQALNARKITSVRSPHKKSPKKSPIKLSNASNDETTKSPDDRAIGKSGGAEGSQTSRKIATPKPRKVAESSNRKTRTKRERNNSGDDFK